MTSLFQRRCSVIIGTLRVDDLHAAFKVEKSAGKEPNSLELKLDNVAESSRAAMQQKGARVVVLAGYEGSVGQIFAGDVRSVDHIRQGTTWTTRILAGDGERAYSHARVNESFAPGVKVADVVQRLAGLLGVDPGNAREKARAIPGEYLQGLTAHGRAARALDKVLEPAGLEWSIQDGRLQILAPTETLRTQAVAVNPDTGLVGSPEMGTPAKKGGRAVLKVRSLLQHSVRPGVRVELRSDTHRGVFRVEKVTHTGDTAGGDWYSDLEVIPA